MVFVVAISAKNSLTPYNHPTFTWQLEGLLVATQADQYFPLTSSVAAVGTSRQPTLRQSYLSMKTEDWAALTFRLSKSSLASINVMPITEPIVSKLNYGNRGLEDNKAR